VILFHPRFQLGRDSQLIDKGVEIGFRLGGIGFRQNFREAFMQEIKWNAADGLGHSRRGSNSRGEIDRASLRKRSRSRERGKCR
jgi:hypothetical protein